MQIMVRDNNVDQALRALKKKLQREGVYREMKLRRHYEKPSEIIAHGLVDLGLLTGDPKENIEKKTYEKYFMHRTGHWLGMDVHDVGRYKLEDGWRIIEPGMAFTVEPGIYIQPGTEGASEEFFNIGIRIEDMLLITANGSKLLSGALPRDPDQIQKFLAEK